jgi:RNA polymerase sigma-70 factor (ECF subfamily)
MDSRRERVQTALLIIRIRRGDDLAFGQLVAMWEKRLFYFISRIVTSEQDAWDVSQETWMKVHRALGTLKDPATFPTWAYQIARHTAISLLRKRTRHELFEEDDPPHNLQVESDPNGFDAEDAQRIHRGLDQLALPQREAMTLFFLEGFSLNEIAQVTGVSTGTIKSRLHYGKLNLRAVMDQEEQSHA